MAAFFATHQFEVGKKTKTDSVLKRPNKKPHTYDKSLFNRL